MDSVYYSTKTLKTEYGISESTSKKIAGRAAKFIVNFGAKVDRAWRFNFREKVFICSVINCTKEFGEDEAFYRNMELFYGIDCKRSNHQL